MTGVEFQPNLTSKINISPGELAQLPPDLRFKIEAILKQNEYLLANAGQPAAGMIDEEAHYKDALTGAANRHAFNSQVDIYVRLMRRHKIAQQKGRPSDVPHVTAITLVLEGIQQIRQFSGQRAMEAALKDTVQFFGHHLRPDDFFARTGTEHFAIIMRTTQENADQAMQRLRREFEKNFTAPGQTQHYLSFSYGACQVGLAHVSTAQVMQQCAVAQKADHAHLPK